MVPADEAGYTDVFAEDGLELSGDRASGGLEHVPALDSFICDRQGARLRSRRRANAK